MGLTISEREKSILEAIGHIGSVKGASVSLDINEKYISQRLSDVRRKLARAASFRNQINAFKRKYPILRKYLPEIPDETYETYRRLT